MPSTHHCAVHKSSEWRGVMSSDQPLSVKERIAALQKNAAGNASTSTSGAGIKGEGVGGKKRVSALAGDLSSKLNMNALLSGGAGGKRPSSGNAGHVAVAVADPSRSAQAIMTTAKAKDDEATGIVGEGYLQHPPRAMIPPGRRRRRGAG